MSDASSGLARNSGHQGKKCPKITALEGSKIEVRMDRRDAYSGKLVKK